MTILESALKRFEPLLPILCCPYTKAPLTLISRDELEQVAPALTSQQRRGDIAGALWCEVSARAYPIIGSVISFLEQDILRSAPQSVTGSAASPNSASAIKQQVKRWYDDFGWQPTNDGLYGDTSLFSQVGRGGHGFYEMNSHLSFLDRLPAGDFLLDAASGAVAHPEYLAYSWCYKYRVCVDMSLTALQEAARKIGQRGFCCMADICRLPFRENVFDGIVSGYTIQHIPESEQKQAVAELYRVLAPAKYCCVMTDTGRSVARSVLSRALKILMKPAFNQKDGDSQPSVHSPGDLYFAPHSAAWWRKAVHDLPAEGSVRSLRIFEKRQFESLFGDSVAAAKGLRMIEMVMPRVLAGISKYCLVSFSKKGPQPS